VKDKLQDEIHGIAFGIVGRRQHNINGRKSNLEIMLYKTMSKFLGGNL
jgi:hypothetical protein